MDGYLKVEINKDILSRISEADVAQWIAAKLAELREKTPAIHNIQLGADFRNYRPTAYYDINWTLHGADKCALSHTTIESCSKELLEALADNPKKRAAEARWKAKQLIEEAEALETLNVG